MLFFQQATRLTNLCPQKASPDFDSSVDTPAKKASTSQTVPGKGTIANSAAAGNNGGVALDAVEAVVESGAMAVEAIENADLIAGAAGAVGDAAVDAAQWVVGDVGLMGENVADLATSTGCCENMGECFSSLTECCSDGCGDCVDATCACFGSIPWEAVGEFCACIGKCFSGCGKKRAATNLPINTIISPITFSNQGSLQANFEVYVPKIDGRGPGENVVTDQLAMAAKYTKSDEFFMKPESIKVMQGRAYKCYN